MPNTALTEAIKEAYASAPSDVVYLETIEIYHPDAEETIYLVRDAEAKTLTLEDDSEVEFEPCPFRMELPTSGDNGVQELNLSIDNIDRRISDYLETIKDSIEAVQIKYRPYLASDLTTPQLNPPLILFLSDVTITEVAVSGRATFADIINKKFPTELYTRARFPSLSN